MASTADERSNGDIVELVVAYAKQETIGPLRGVGRWIGWGIASMLFVSTGVVLIVLGALRLLQSFSAFDGSWSWVPYGVCLLLCAAIVGFALSQIRKPQL
jgi:hypothetical protein